ncbi:MAG: carbohydrate ABC transporter permease [Rhodoferax sp.]|nr:carbohydrate ABC transporter permease [Rhodoferax sp.]MCB2041601.1 carbohydrate ABC transporter permease [Rhodoferax sp.]MCW5628975.1 carbohydrate ABC transporter permease [Rhodoferax sp.]MCW5645557.1 carbohydrate ABC transporter permease [Rhodoferax sp.]MCZ4316475.1 carbohydrate ABC transporter permease [Comamonadaceae bacterium G21597-S1]
MRAEAIAVGIGKALAVLLILGWSLGPLVFMVMSSFKPGQEIFAVPPRLAFEPTFTHYRALWQQWQVFFDGLINSFIVTAGATVVVVVASTLAGYACSRFPGPTTQRSVLFLIVVRLLPPIVITLPLFGIANLLRLNDTHLVLIVLYATFFVSMGTVLMRTFIEQIPKELDEAAMVDGASRMTILWRIVRPLSRQGMLAVAVFVIVYAWNEFLFAFIFTSTRAKTAPLVISEMLGSLSGVDWGVLFAASTVQLVPILLFVMLMQKHLVAGLTGGAVKG